MKLHACHVKAIVENISLYIAVSNKQHLHSQSSEDCDTYERTHGAIFFLDSLKKLLPFCTLKCALNQYFPKKVLKNFNHRVHFFVEFLKNKRKSLKTFLD